MSQILRLFNKDTQILLTFSEPDILIRCFYGGAAAPVGTVIDRWPELEGLRAFFQRDTAAQCMVPPGRLDEARGLLGRLAGRQQRNLRITVDDRAAALIVRESAPEDFFIRYERDGDGLKRVLPGSVRELTDGWLLRGFELWHYPGLDRDGLLLIRKERFSREELLGFVRDVLPAFRRAGVRAQSAVEYDPVPAVRLTLHSVAPDRAGVRPNWAVPPASVDESLAIPGHVLSGGSLRPGIPPGDLKKALTDAEKDAVLRGEALGTFLDRRYIPWKPWIDGDTAAFEATHRWIDPPYCWILSVRQGLTRGVGRPVASPVACVGRERLTVQALIEARKGEYCRFPSGWTRRRDLDTLGLDEAGLFIGKISARPFRLDAELLVHCGGAKLDGLWRGMVIDGDTFAVGGGKHACAGKHLKYLIRWGLNGGLTGGYEAFAAYGLPVLREHAAKYPDCRILVLASPGDAEALGRSHPSGDIRIDTYDRAASSGQDTARWDILTLIEPETGYDDPAARHAVEQTAKIRTACRLFFPYRSGRDLGDGPGRWIAALAGFRQASDLPGLLIRDCRETAALPAPFVFSGQLPPEALYVSGETPRVYGGALSPAVSEAPRRVPSRDNPLLGMREALAGPPARPAGSDPPVRTGGVIDRRNADFFMEARNLAGRTAAGAERVPFVQGMPEYRLMDRAQRQWYFHLRERIASGEYPETDAAYLYVRIYELLALIGVKDADEGLRQLMGIWRHYREKYPALDRNMSVWTADFIHVHPCGTGITDLMRVSPVMCENGLNEALDRMAEAGPLELPVPILEELSQYRFTGSKFFKQADRERMEGLITGAVTALDTQMRDGEGKGILDTAADLSRHTHEVDAFEGARRDRVRRYVIRVRHYRNSVRLQTYLKNVVRYTENLLREREGYAARLQGITLDDPAKKAVAAFIAEAYGPADASPAGEVSSAARVVIDPENLRRLREETAAVRETLLASLLRDGKTGQAEREEERLTDLTHVKRILDGLPPSRRQLLLLLRAEGWAAERSTIAQKYPEGRFLDAVIDEINRAALDELGCFLLEREGGRLVAAEDYRDELEYLTARTPEKTSGWTVREDDLTEEWLRFFRGADTGALAAVLEGGRALDEYARRRGTMPGVLRDGINSLSQETIGDLILNDGGFYEDYSDIIRTHLIKE